MSVGIRVPNGWNVVIAEPNNKMRFEGATFYARMESPLPPDKAALTFGNTMVAGVAKGFDMEGPTALSDEERTQYKDSQCKFERRHALERSQYSSGWKVFLSNEPSYYAIYAFPRKNGSVVELLSISAL